MKTARRVFWAMVLIAFWGLCFGVLIMLGNETGNSYNF